MEHLIDKDALIAKIDRQIELLKPFLGACAGQIVAEANAKLSVLEELKNLLDSLEVKEVDLDEEADNYWGTLTSDVKNSIYFNDFYKIAKHFFELGMSVSNKVQKGE